jgi:hypothetical protein
MIASGYSSAQFFNGASYASGALFSAGGSAMSMVGAGHTINTFIVGMSEGFVVANTNQIGFSYGASITDGFTFGDSGPVDPNAPPTGIVYPLAGIATHVSDSMTFHGSATYIWTAGGYIMENLVAGDGVTVLARTHVLMTQALKVAQSQVVGMLATLSEHITLTPAFTAHLGSFMLNRLMVSDIASAQLRYAVTLADTLHIADVLAWFLGGTLNDGFTVGDDAERAYIAGAAITEFFTVALGQTYSMAFRITVNDGFEFEADDILKMIYTETISEIIDIDVLYQSLGGNTTAWAINTRTGAVTEYQGWNFNSFVQFGNKYVAAAKDGLYELNGPTDNGLNVIADIMGGFLQPAGPHLSGLKGVYLGQTGQGYWLLKIETGDGREYVYQRLSNPAMMTTKFTIGKGINARYIGWELINVEGQDFDIDTIEFVPMIRARRI